MSIPSKPQYEPVRHQPVCHLAINERSKAPAGRQEDIRTRFRAIAVSHSQSVVDFKMHAHEKTHLHVQGLPALRTAVAEFHIKKDLADIHPDQVLIGPGSKERCSSSSWCSMARSSCHHHPGYLTTPGPYSGQTGSFHTYQF